MILVYLIVVTVAPDAPDDNMQWLREYYAREVEERNQAIEALRASTHSITCERCGDEFWGYDTPGRAKMALSGHQRWCKRKG